MYVKSLTMRGFKSFASATTLRLESGITCIVGPNGSGKSNVVDALAWVMGEQGATSLRGGKMEDVVFAGTTSRPPLGRAEVSMTIDNTDGALPIDYTEVTITRTMFRNGGSDYAINDTSCRLLDVQELLSDSGIGHEMHVIVGQGQLDHVLRATPLERRGFIEEAAGVLKHRKRKERALRKLESMEGNLTRLCDLTAEIRRQLGPLGRQADTARRAIGIQADVRDARLRLLADDITALTCTVNEEIEAEAALIRRRADCEERARELSAQIEAEEHAGARDAPALSRAQAVFYDATATAQRLQSTADLAHERIRLMVSAIAEDTAAARGRTGDRDPHALTDLAQQMRAQEAALHADIAVAEQALIAAETARLAAEQAHAAEEERATRMLQAAADRREGIARLAGQVAAKHSQIEAEQAELGRLRQAEGAIVARAHTAEQEFAALEATIVGVEQAEEGLDEAYEAAAESREQAQRQVAAANARYAAAQVALSSAQARREALTMSVQHRDGAAAWLERGSGVGVLGTVSARITVEVGYEAHIAAALGWVGEAVVVNSVYEGVSGLAWLRENDHGQAGAIIAERVPVQAGTRPLRDLPEGARWADEVLSADTPELTEAVREHLRHIVLIRDADDATTLVGSAPSTGVVAVTSSGDMYGPGWMRGGSSQGPSRIEIAAALDDARVAEREAHAETERCGVAVNRFAEELAQAEAATEAAMQVLHRSDAQMAAVAEQLGQLGSSMRGAAAERARNQLAVAESEQSVQCAEQELSHVQQRLNQARAAAPRSSADQSSATHAPESSNRAALADAAAGARAAEMQARLRLRTGEERAHAAAQRASALELAAREEIAAREQAAGRRQVRQRQADTARAVAHAAAYLARSMHDVIERADVVRSELAAAHARREEGLQAARVAARSAAVELAELTSSVHRDEVARAEQRLRIETLQARCLDEHGLDAETLVAEFGPDQPVPMWDSVTGRAELAPAGDGVVSRGPFVRVDQEKRLRKAERALSALGKVNPLALEEFAALEERHTFLSTQIDDLRRSSADLRDIVKEVDERVERVFAEAFADTAAQFEQVFSRLFPGGQGRLVLTDPDEMLTTGVDVEARPPGKKIKRLSLLSGGERSLTAVALLIALFKARPSPFYIMDEVEAALDDTNLGRLITLFEELRDSSQLIVITHQKRTMEVADALYGVSMQGDGVTTVISQRLREVAL